MHELYHLTVDPDERMNLIDDSNCTKILFELRDRLFRWFIEFANPIYDGAKLPVTGSGQSKILGTDSCAEEAFSSDRIIMDTTGFPIINRKFDLGKVTSQSNDVT